MDVSNSKQSGPLNIWRVETDSLLRVQSEGFAIRCSPLSCGWISCALSKWKFEAAIYRMPVDHTITITIYSTTGMIRIDPAATYVM